ncbi:hypothetical protein UFOVP296_28 [uncultured Caudovirales phage]|uniref:Uncharacterized protein n=1 Tax=uncultured Caudovirales phage TaxID=2100421 RepID=A0A6J5LT27_9CAUD|nr:hypothetical protein UFOVP296_28 [uncultured Caudovirales phage]CAB4169792.1 hypothetical protein UFOVP912_3 [uncultured Caudovirales phage]CAB4199374.1 hypothetical protein UFOVP1334_35 [uncultured Caudovirales phage]
MAQYTVGTTATELNPGVAFGVTSIHIRNTGIADVYYAQRPNVTISGASTMGMKLASDERVILSASDMRLGTTIYAVSSAPNTVLVETFVG